MSDDRHELIRARAHQIWEAEGSPEGRHDQHWAQAEQEIAEASAAPAETMPAAKPAAPKRATKAAEPKPAAKPRTRKPA